MSGFPAQVQQVQAPGIPWTFCSTNPRQAVLAGPGALVAGDNLFCGFAWADPYTQILNSDGTGPVTGIVIRNWQGIITTYLSEATLQIYPGSQIGAMSSCDVWAPNGGATEALPGQKAYASVTDGSVVAFAASGSPPAGASSTTASIAAGTSSFTGVLAQVYNAQTGVVDCVLTASAVTGLLVPGEIIAGTSVITGTQIVEQLSGTTRGAGTYSVNYPQDIASEAMTGTYGLFTEGTTTGAFAVGDVLAGSGGGGVTTGTTIRGAGAGAATWYVSPTQTVTSSTITSTAYIETKWYCRTPGAPGEVVKISDQPLG